MGRLPLNSVGRFFIRLTAALRGSYALVAVLAIVCYLFFKTASETKVPYVPAAAFILFAFLILAVAARFYTMGPEAPRLQPSMSVTNFGIHIYNVDPQLMQHPEFRVLLSQMQRPLPPPAGVIEGPSSDPGSIREISPEEAKELQKQDNA